MKPSGEAPSKNLLPAHTPVSNKPITDIRA
jgi:hypothetical protein